jgi:hypothetical protein
MPTYLITNRIPPSFQPSPEAFAAWTDWFEQLGPYLEQRGNPTFKRTSLGNCGSETDEPRVFRTACYSNVTPGSD